MKTLYLMRHAKSSWKDPALQDFDRPLNKRGKKDAPLMGDVMKKMGVRPDLILSSPACRATATARTIAERIGLAVDDIVTDEAIYGASVDDLLEVIRAIDRKFDFVMIVGHNPELTALANDLTDCEVENIPTCGVFCVEFDVNSWKEIAPRTGVFLCFDHPKNHQ